MQRLSDGRKNQQRNRIQNKNRAKRYRHFFFVGFQNRADGGDGAAAANRGAGRNQKGRISAHSQKFAERQPRQQRERNSQRGVDESAAARFQDFVQIHSETQSDDGALQKRARDAAAFADVGMLKAEAKENSNGESDGRRKQSGKRKCERENKNYFREGGHRPGKEYQAGHRESQRARLFTRFSPSRSGRGLSGWRGSRRGRKNGLFRSRLSGGGGALRGGCVRGGERRGGCGFCGGGFADLAIAVIDAALRERESAAAVAGSRVELVERGNFLLRRQF